MLQNLFLILILVFFILAFAIRNIKTFLSTKQSIKGKSSKLTLSILLSTMIYLLLLLRLTVLPFNWILEANLSGFAMIRFAGYAFVLAGFILGILALIAMRNSWRVGIRYDQKTDLVISGIYRFSRNPYFLSYNLLIFGYILIFPSPILAILWILLAITFHRMILEEEAYLESVHGEEFLKYKKRVNRYLTLG
ncbi:MAG: isoprenylcysteine carboxylmethyltransferase family protein [Bacteroidales bacterium]|nr:isoprenylcysteine carboxylmethyltransferase family protein [Bacteroidales bacterium]